MADEAIRFAAQVFKVQTTIDGGIRLTLDLGEAETEVAKRLMDIKRASGLLAIAAVPLDIQQDNKSDIHEGKVRKPGWQTA